MNSARRVQFALNSENPEVVKKGLLECIETICSEDSTATNRIHLRSSTTTNNATQTNECDFVKKYLELSPQFEEFYLLWSQPSRMLDQQLCVLHTLAFTLLATAQETLAARKSLLTRLLKNDSNMIVEQLQSQESALRTASMTLLTWCVTSKCVIPDKVIDTFQTSLSSMKSKKSDKKDSLMVGYDVVRQSNEKVVAMRCVVAFLDKATDIIASTRFIEDRRSFRTLLSRLEELEEVEVRGVLDDTRHLLSSQPKLLLAIDQILTTHVLGEFAAIEDADIIQIVTDFLKSVVHLLTGVKERRVGGGSGGSSASSFLQTVLTAFQPHLRPEHKEIEREILSSRTGLLRKYLRKFQVTSTSITSDIIVKLSHLHYLIDLLGSRSFLHVSHGNHRKASEEEHEDSNNALDPSTSHQGSVEVLFLTSTELNKQTLTRLLSHESERVVALTLQLFTSSLHLIASTSSQQQQRGVMEEVTETLPDVTALFPLWQKWSSSFLNPSTNPSQSSADPTSGNAMIIEDDIDIGITSFTPEEELSMEVVKDRQHPTAEEVQTEVRREMIRHYLLCVQSLLSCTALPNSLFATSFDPLKLLEALLSSSSEVVSNEHLVEAVQVVSLTSERRLLRWYGSADDTNKALAHALTTGHTSSLTPFQHLLHLLSSLSHNEEVRDLIEEVLSRAMKLQDDVSTSHYSLWIRYATSSSTSAEERKRRLHSLDLLVRLTHHLKAEISHYLFSSINDDISATSLLYSTALLLYHGHFTPFLTAFPHYIQTRLTTSAESRTSFLQVQFMEGLRKEVRGMLHVITPLLILTHPLPLPQQHSLHLLVTSFPNLIEVEGEDLKKVVKGVKVEALMSAVTSSALISSSSEREQEKRLALLRKMTKKNKKAMKKKKTLTSSSTTVGWKEVWYGVLLKVRGGEEEVLEEVFQHFLSDTSSQTPAISDVHLLLTHLCLVSQRLLLALDTAEQAATSVLCEEADRCHERLVAFVTLCLSQMSGQRRKEVVASLRQSELLGKALFQLSPFGLTCRHVMLALLTSVKDEDLVTSLVQECQRHLSKEIEGGKERCSLLFREHSSLHLLETLLKAELKSSQGGAVSSDAFSLLATYCEHRLCSTPELLHRTTVTPSDDREEGVVPNSDKSSDEGFDLLMSVWRYAPPALLRRVAQRLLTLYLDTTTYTSSSHYTQLALLSPQIYRSADVIHSFQPSILLPILLTPSDHNPLSLQHLLAIPAESRYLAREVFRQCGDDVIQRLLGASSTQDDEKKQSKKRKSDDSNNNSSDEEVLNQVLTSHLSHYSSTPYNEVWSSLQSLLLSSSDAVEEVRDLLLDVIFEGGEGCFEGVLFLSINHTTSTPSLLYYLEKVLLFYLDTSLHSLNISSTTPPRIILSGAKRVTTMTSLLQGDESLRSILTSSAVLALLEKWTKTLLKHHLHHPALLRHLLALLSALYSDSDGGGEEWLGAVVGSGNVLSQPLTVLRFVVTHSKINVVLAAHHLHLLASSSRSEESEGDLEEVETEEEEEVEFARQLSSDVVAPASTVVTLRLLLLLLQTARRRGEEMLGQGGAKVVQRVEQVVTARYEGRMTSADHLSLHILHLLATPLTSSGSEVSAPHTTSLALPNILCIKSSEELADDVAAFATSSLDRVTTFIKPEVVHGTINAFPLSRGLTSSSSSLSSESRSPNPRAYDPAFVLPALYLAVREVFALLQPSGGSEVAEGEEGSEEVSEEVWRVLRRGCDASVSRIRRLFSCGAVALLLMSQSSQNEEVRAMSRATLVMIHDVTRRLSADVDPNFRDRPNALLLLDFLRHSFVSAQPSQPPLPPPLPATSSLFLARASLILLTSGHLMYSAVGSYLLAKPCYDVRDVPLFEQIVLTDRALLTTSSNNSEERAAKFFVLRMIRDGLVTSADHDNLVRKNIYQRLMIAFPSLTHDDHRFGLICLELFTKAVTIDTSSCHYLVQKCHLLPWLSEVVLNMRRGGAGDHSLATPFLANVISLLRHILATASTSLDTTDNSAWLMFYTQNYRHVITVLATTFTSSSHILEPEYLNSDVILHFQQLCEEVVEVVANVLSTSSSSFIGRGSVEEAAMAVCHVSRDLLLAVTEVYKKERGAPLRRCVFTSFESFSRIFLSVTSFSLIQTEVFLPREVIALQSVIQLILSEVAEEVYEKSHSGSDVSSDEVIRVMKTDALWRDKHFYQHRTTSLTSVTRRSSLKTLATSSLLSVSSAVTRVQEHTLHLLSQMAEEVRVVDLHTSSHLLVVLASQLLPLWRRQTLNQKAVRGSEGSSDDNLTAMTSLLISIFLHLISFSTSSHPLSLLCDEVHRKCVTSFDESSGSGIDAVLEYVLDIFSTSLSLEERRRCGGEVVAEDMTSLSDDAIVKRVSDWLENEDSSLEQSIERLVNDDACRERKRRRVGRASDDME